MNDICIANGSLALCSNPENATADIVTFTTCHENETQANECFFAEATMPQYACPEVEAALESFHGERFASSLRERVFAGVVFSFAVACVFVFSFMPL